MFSKEQIKLISNKYDDVVNKIIGSNLDFYGFHKTIKWCFRDYDQISIVATCDKKTDVISINAKAFLKSLNEDNLLTVEYYLLHEIRHIFQHLLIKDYERHEEVFLEEEIIKKWIFENKHYVKSLDENGKENSEYFLQDSEMDAYAFSLAVMRYKYPQEKIEHLYVPPIYGAEFYRIVDDWIKMFQEENLYDKKV